MRHVIILVHDQCVSLFLSFLQEKVFDPFVIYNEDLGYASVRAAVNDAHHGRHVDRLVESTKVAVSTDICVYLFKLIVAWIIFLSGYEYD